MKATETGRGTSDNPNKEACFLAILHQVPHESCFDSADFASVLEKNLLSPDIPESGCKFDFSCHRHQDKLFQQLQ